MCASVVASGCAVATDQAAPPTPTLEEFVASTYQEPFEGGVWIIDGDTPVESRKRLEEIYTRIYPPQGALIVDRFGGVDSVWTSSQKLGLTYCVSNSFGSQKTAVVNAMIDATESWEAIADVDFHYDASQDANCNGQNSSVVFDVRPTQGAPYLARAFFPGQSRSTRNVIIDGTAYNAFISLTGILRHELGHSLGFRHEHTRPEANASACFEDNAWRELTGYDHASVMHYPQCNGSNYTFELSPLDIEGAQALYGAPTSATAPGDELPVCELDDSAQVSTDSWKHFGPFSVEPGEEFNVSMSGSGDADLYVRFDGKPAQAAYDCRPYLNHSQESCMLDIPTGVSQVYVSVHGYTAANVTIAADWQCSEQS